ncbi:pseudouridine synthase [Nannocystaceae bacterium ST9]
MSGVDESSEPAALGSLVVVHRDDRLLAIAKPSGLLVHRGWARDDEVAVELVEALVGARVHMLHRLDRATSGVLLFALDVEAARHVGDLFERGLVRKRYVALVRGLAPDELVVDHPLRRVDVEDDGTRLPALTRLRRLAACELAQDPDEPPRQWPRRYSWIEARPETGRTHQIRRHCKHAALPILGDTRYGKGEHNRLFRERFGLQRLALHAIELALEDPGGETLVVRAELPADLRATLAALGMPALG